MFGGLLPLLVLIGIIVLVARMVGSRDRTTSDSQGVSVRRIFQYLAMLATLVLSCVGLAGLIDAAATSAQQITVDTGAVARSISFVVVGLPAFVALALYTRRGLREDPAEVRSAGWALYLTLALLVSLVISVSVLIALFGQLLTGEGFDRAALVNALIWGGVWAAHWWVAQRHGYAPNLRVEHLLGSLIGLSVMLSGAAIAAANGLVEIYDAVFDIPAVGSAREAIVLPLAAGAVGGLVWGWYWLRTTLNEERSLLWTAYVLLAGVLSGVLMVVAGLGTSLFRVLQWFLADPSGTAATHFEVIPAAIAVVLVGGTDWMYHRFILSGGGERKRTEVERVYDYLLAGAGLLVTGGGIATLLTYAVWALAGTEITGSDNDVIAVALTLLAVGAPLWGIYWTRAQRSRARDATAEVQSTTRRVYLFFIVGISGLVALVSLIVLVYVFVENVLDGTVGASTLDAMAVPIGLVATAGALAAYHFSVVRHDRAEMPAAPKPSVREVILITSDGVDLTKALTEADMRVRTFHAAANPVDLDSVDEVLDALGNETHQTVVVVTTEGGGFEVVPLD
jgi:Flp pilus assembly pilin Flp